MDPSLQAIINSPISMSIFNQNDFIKLEDISQYNPTKTCYGFCIEIYCTVSTNHNFICNTYLQIRYDDVSSHMCIYEYEYRRPKKLATYYINTLFDFNILINKWESYLINKVKTNKWNWIGDAYKIETLYGCFSENDANWNLY